MMIFGTALAGGMTSCAKPIVYTQGAEIKATDDPKWFRVNKAWVQQRNEELERLLAALKICKEAKP